MFFIYYMNIYIDGVFDLFHYGHIESFRKCKELYPNAKLIVGVISDDVATSYKRKPIYREKHRYALVKNSKYVDNIIEDPPLVITKYFMDTNKIGKVLHSFSNKSDGDKQEHFFSYPKSIDSFTEFEYCNETSTSKIISDISNYLSNV